MDGGSHPTASPFRRSLELWRAVPGGIDSEGNAVSKPWELQKAELVDGLCQKYSCLPSQLMNEDVDLIMRMNLILSLGSQDQDAKMESSPIEEQLANMSRITDG